jgi:CheY-like chemotaxis protein
MAAGSAKRVLVVDDELEVVDTLCRLLARLGHEAVGVTDGSDAIEHFHRGRYDVVAIDLLMPEMDGLELIRRLRSLDANARIVAFTGKQLDVTDALNHVGVRLVHKPIVTMADADALVAASQ